MQSLLLAFVVCACVALAGCNNDKSDKSGTSNSTATPNSSNPSSSSGTSSAGSCTSPTTAPTTQDSASLKPVNTVCPVCNMKVHPALTTTYQSKVIGFACTGCADKFRKDPEKHVANLK